MLIKAKSDFIKEEDDMDLSMIDESTSLKEWYCKEMFLHANARPRKTYIDEAYIQINPESIVFYSDLQHNLNLLDIHNSN